MEDRQKILAGVAEGKIGVEEANARLALLEAGEAPREGEVARGEVISPGGLDASAVKWKKWWQIPFWISVAVTALAGYWMYGSFLGHGMSWGFWFSFLLLLIGILGIVASVLSRNSRWLHLRIRERGDKKSHHIAFSFPIPFRFAIHLIQMFAWALPEEIREEHIDEIIQAIDDSLTADQPIEIFVDEEDGDHVEIIIC